MIENRNNLRVLWVTNLQAPYREPIWNALSELCELEVIFLAEAHPGRPWTYTSDRPYRSRVLRSMLLGSRDVDRALYVLLPSRGFGLSAVDVIILGSWESPAYWQILLRAKLHGVATALFVENSGSSSRFTGKHPVAYLRQLFLRSVDAALTSGEASTSFLRKLALPVDRIVTGFNSVDVRAVAADVHKERACIEGNARAQGHQYLYVGRLLALKRVDRMLEAFAAVAERSDRLTIVGDGPEAVRLEKIAGDLGIGSRVRLVGEVDAGDVPRYLARANTLLLASERETWGMVLNEALAAGLHVVATRNVGAAASIAAMRGVFLCDPDAASLAAQMIKSRASWAGPIEEPAILQYGPRRSAEDAIKVCLLAIENRLQRSRARDKASS